MISRKFYWPIKEKLTTILLRRPSENFMAVYRGIGRAEEIRRQGRTSAAAPAGPLYDMSREILKKPFIKRMDAVCPGAPIDIRESADRAGGGGQVADGSAAAGEGAACRL